MPLVELFPFDDGQIRAFASARFNEEGERTAFVNALQRVDWLRNATPLQLEMAATLYQQPSGLPSREADLVFWFIDSRIALANSELPVPDLMGNELEGWALYRARLRTILQILALKNLNAGALTYPVARDALVALRSDEELAPLGQRPNECLDYVSRDAIVRVGLLRATESAEGREFGWEHRTVMEALAAEAIVAASRGERATLEAEIEKINSVMHRHGQRFALTLFAAMERQGLGGLVAIRIEAAIKAPFSARTEALLALRALAAGLQFPPSLRSRLVSLLVRVCLAPKAGALLCAEIFATSSDLPNAVDILQRVSLREDVTRAMWERLPEWDPRRRGINQPLQVSKAEAKLLDLLHMWNHWLSIGLELVRPHGGDTQIVPASSRQGYGGPQSRIEDGGQVRVIDRGGFSIRHRDGSVTAVELPARSFLEGVAAMAQQLPRNLPPSHVVSLYLRVFGESIDPPMPPDEGENRAPSE